MGDFVKRELGKTFPKHAGGVKKQAMDILKAHRSDIDVT